MVSPCIEPVFKADVSARASPSILIAYLLMSGCGQRHECGQHGCSAVLCEVLSMKTDGNLFKGMFK